MKTDSIHNKNNTLLSTIYIYTSKDLPLVLKSFVIAVVIGFTNYKLVKKFFQFTVDKKHGNTTLHNDINTYIALQ